MAGGGGTGVAAWRAPAGLLGALLLGLALAAPARAQPLTTAGPSCQRQCGGQVAAIRANPPEVQACLLRCAAAQRFARDNPRAATGRGRPVGLDQLGPLPPVAAAPYAGPARPGPVLPMRNTASAGSPLPSAPPPAAPPGRERWGAAHAAAAPGTDLGLALGMADRLQAHGASARRCQAGGAECRLLLEFTDRCGAVAQARRTLGLIRTADAGTYQVGAAGAGSGPTREAAEAAATEACRARDRGAACVVAASGCAP